MVPTKRTLPILPAGVDAPEHDTSRSKMAAKPDNNFLNDSPRGLPGVPFASVSIVSEFYRGGGPPSSSEMLLLMNEESQICSSPRTAEGAKVRQGTMIEGAKVGQPPAPVGPVLFLY